MQVCEQLEKKYWLQKSRFLHMMASALLRCQQYLNSQWHDISDTKNGIKLWSGLKIYRHKSKLLNCENTLLDIFLGEGWLYPLRFIFSVPSHIEQDIELDNKKTQLTCLSSPRSMSHSLNTPPKLSPGWFFCHQDKLSYVKILSSFHFLQEEVQILTLLINT